jgi:hypothetical protein
MDTERTARLDSSFPDCHRSGNLAFMDFLKKLLPTIGHLLGGPLGGAAVEAAGKALGLSDATTEKVQKALTSGNLTAEQIAALQAADLQLKTRMAELGIDAEKLAQEDRMSARNMQTAMASWVPPVLACGVTLGFFGILIGLLTGDLKLWESTTLSLLIGSLSTAFSSVLAFYYGASHKPPDFKK